MYMPYSIFPAVIRFGDLTRVQCIDVNVSDDQIVEEGETILLSLLPLDMPYMLESGSVTNAVVMVIDDDGMGRSLHLKLCVCACVHQCVCAVHAMYVLNMNVACTHKHPLIYTSTHCVCVCVYMKGIPRLQ